MVQIILLQGFATNAIAAIGSSPTMAYLTEFNLPGGKWGALVKYKNIGYQYFVK
jgi:hypothetical protein